MLTTFTRRSSGCSDRGRPGRAAPDRPPPRWCTADRWPACAASSRMVSGPAASRTSALARMKLMPSASATSGAPVVHLEHQGAHRPPGVTGVLVDRGWSIAVLSSGALHDALSAGSGCSRSSSAVAPRSAGHAGRWSAGRAASTASPAPATIHQPGWLARASWSADPAAAGVDHRADDRHPERCADLPAGRGDRGRHPGLLAGHAGHRGVGDRRVHRHRSRSRTPRRLPISQR